MLDRLGLEKDYTGTNLIDMNPGLGQFSAALHERLQPRTHVLLEPEASCRTSLAERLGRKHPRMTILDLNGHNWDTYDAIFTHQHLYASPDHMPRATYTPPAAGLNHQLLFVGNFTRLSNSRRFVSQILSTCFLQSWLQRFGRVRFLLWLQSGDTDRLLPPLVQARTRPSILTDACCDLTIVATTPGIRAGKGYQASQLGSAADTSSSSSSSSPSPPCPFSPYKQRRSLDSVLRRTVKDALLPLERWRNLCSRPMVDGHRRLLRLQNAESHAIYALRTYFKSRNGVSSTAQYDNLSLPELEKLFHDTEGVPLPAPDADSSITAEQRSSFAEFEELFITSAHGDLPRKRSIFDEKYARSLEPPMLQIWRPHNAHPLPIPQDHTYPAGRPLALLDFQPHCKHDFFNQPPEGTTTTAIATTTPRPDLLNKRFVTFDWIVRNLFTLRAQDTKLALKGLVPGGEYLLDEIPDGRGHEIGLKRVRTLTLEELIDLAMAWERWPFKPDDDSEWGGYSRPQLDID